METLQHLLPKTSIYYSNLIESHPAALDKAACLHTDCHNILKCLGVTPNYIGFHQTLSAVELAAQKPDTLFSVTKHLYPVIAEEYGTSWKAVERNIRAVISRAWKNNPELMKTLAGYALTRRPKAAQFIAMLADRNASL